MPDPLRFLGIIPARYASSRFPGKAIVEVNGKMMIQRVFEQASKSLDTVYVATDDERIFKEVKKFGGCVVMTSPDHQSGTDRCAEAVQIIERELGQAFDVVLNVQGDEPFIKPEQLDLIKSCFDREQVEIATLVKQIEQHDELIDPNRPKVIVSIQGEALYFSRSPIPYFRGKDQEEWVHEHIHYKHIGLYGYRKETLLEIARLKQSPLEITECLEQLRWLENGYKIFVRITSLDSYGIDRPEDLERMKGAS